MTSPANDRRKGSDTAPLLTVDNLTVTFQRRGQEPFRAVDGVSFSVRPGQTVGLVGESGCGKSVTSLAIMGLLPKRGNQVTGTVDYEGTNLLTLSDDDMRDRRGKDIAMVFQDPLSSLNPVIPVGLQVTEVLERHRGIKRKDAMPMAADLLKRVGIPDPNRRIKDYPHQMSGGMRQRALIAIALACDPDLLICDEPTTALDVTIQAKILELIKKIQEERGISVIYITHDLGVVAKVADYVNVMYAGKIVEKGTINEIYYDPRHPYTWGLLSAMPDLDTADERLYTIPGSPPNLLHEKQGDAFAPRNRFALEVDDKADPPMFKISDTHYAATWLLDPRAPKVEMPAELRARIERMKKGAGIDGSEL